MSFHIVLPGKRHTVIYNFVSRLHKQCLGCCLFDFIAFTFYFVYLVFSTCLYFDIKIHKA